MRKVLRRECENSVKMILNIVEIVEIGYQVYPIIVICVVNALGINSFSQT